MSLEIDTGQIAAVQQEVQIIYNAIFPRGDSNFVPKVFAWTNDCFAGKYRNYQPIDARYHDLEHTLQVTLCMARILHGRHRAGALPPIGQKMFELGLLAILLHDSGYLKTRDDLEGTGAKYTLVHVERSVEFAAELLREKNFSEPEISAVQNMIRCTGVNVDLAAIPFQSEEDRVVGFALGTGDLLGQMAARDYVEKLPLLYAEFHEAFLFSGEIGGKEMFRSAEDLIQKTPAFWENFARPKIENDFRGMYRFLNDPLPNGENFYINRIEENISRLRDYPDDARH